jgi:hypothetical protein
MEEQFRSGNHPHNGEGLPPLVQVICKRIFIEHFQGAPTEPDPRSSLPFYKLETPSGAEIGYLKLAIRGSQSDFENNL